MIWFNFKSSILNFQSQESLNGTGYGAEAEVGRTDVAERQPADGLHIVVSCKGGSLRQRAAEETIRRGHNHVAPFVAVGEREEVAARSGRAAQLLRQLAADSLLQRLVRVHKASRQVEGSTCRLLGTTADQQPPLCIDDEACDGSRSVLEQLEAAVGTTT